MPLLCSQAVPGPGAYEVRSSFLRQASSINTEGIEVEHPPFLSQSKVSGLARLIGACFVTFHTCNSLL